MEEDLNDEELEERLYAMVHYVDQTETGLKNTTEKQNDENQNVAFLPKHNHKQRYWRTSSEQRPDTTNISHEQVKSVAETENGKISKDEKTSAMAKIFTNASKSLTPKAIKTSIVIMENENKPNIVELESSDEDEVIEVVLPPKPTITIESSEDEKEVFEVKVNVPISKINSMHKKSAEAERSVSASPVPSIVSSVSDDFIRGDCIAFNISSQKANQPSFDFSLHGSDLLGTQKPVATPISKKKKKKKNRTPKSLGGATIEEKVITSKEELFATPKGKLKKNKRQKIKVNSSGGAVDKTQDYDSDSSVSPKEPKNKYAISEKGIPNADVYESDSNQSFVGDQSMLNGLTNITDENPPLKTIKNSPLKTIKNPEKIKNCFTDIDSVIDLTEDGSPIKDNIVMANVTGFVESDIESEDSTDNIVKPASFLGSTREPAILSEIPIPDFNNFIGNMVTSERRFSIDTLRAEMHKFYNESWGGENFNHEELQKTMSKDKSLWMINAKDRMPSPFKVKQPCNYCNRFGHRSDTCRAKPLVCHMCGTAGHRDYNCPNKICVNCGSATKMFSNRCGRCSSWSKLKCGDCGQIGHPPTHCPDLWRRYHNTIDPNMPLEENRLKRQSCDMYCSGCARRGHYVHMCKVVMQFSGLPTYSPFVNSYRPIYPQCPSVPPSLKRRSKSPAPHIDQKRRNTVPTESTKVISEPTTFSEPLPDYIPINIDKEGHIIQDNEISDTSNVVSVAKIFIPKEAVSKLSQPPGDVWMKNTADDTNVVIQNGELNNNMLIIKGVPKDQDLFQAKLKEWIHSGCGDSVHVAGVKPPKEVKNNVADEQTQYHNIPRKRSLTITKIDKAFQFVTSNLGDPVPIYKELLYLQNHHKFLLKQKVVSPQSLSNNRHNIKEMTMKLNVILLGQAGLADGHLHLKELQVLRTRLVNDGNRFITKELRNEIGQHYHCVFTAVEREDYKELLSKYNSCETKINPVVNAIQRGHNNHKKYLNPVQVSLNSNIEEFDKSMSVYGPSFDVNLQQTHRSLVVCYRKVIQSKPSEPTAKRARMDLIRQLNNQIVSLRKGVLVSFKKLRKMQNQAQLFLSNV